VQADGHPASTQARGYSRVRRRGGSLLSPAAGAGIRLGARRQDRTDRRRPRETDLCHGPERSLARTDRATVERGAALVSTDVNAQDAIRSVVEPTFVAIYARKSTEQKGVLDDAKSVEIQIRTARPTTHKH